MIVTDYNMILSKRSASSTVIKDFIRPSDQYEAQKFNINYKNYDNCFTS
jgi:hypothetical protein